MPDDLVGDPVEHVEDEEGQGEGRPGDGVYPLGSVHKFLPHGVHVSGQRRLRVRVRGRGGVFDGRAILCWRRLSRVAGKIKAAFAHVFVLPDTMSEHKHSNALTWLLHGGISLSGSLRLLPVDQFILPIFCLFCACGFYPDPLTSHPALPISCFLFEDIIFIQTKEKDARHIVFLIITGKCIR